MTKEYKTFKDFYPFYLGEHANRTNKRLHIIGTSLVLIIFIYSLIFSIRTMFLMPFVGYGFAWIGHFFFEKNKPASFKHPFYSLIGDFKMWFEVISGEKPF